MKSRLLIWILCLGVTEVFAQDISNMYNELNKSVVLILVKEQQLAGVNSNTQTRMVTSEGLGSGVYVGKEGEIITASHVVHNAESIICVFSNGEKISAKPVYSSVAADLAVIKTLWPPSKDIPVAKLGNSDDVKVGDKVMIIGAPYGLEHSLSVGYISGRHSQKSQVTGVTKIEYLQTDAAINHGNSGGPMFNMNNEVVGIVSHILSESGGFQGLGFAATVNLAKNLLYNKSSSWLGVDGIVLNPQMAALLNIPSGGGILVQRVVRGSPAAAAGLKGGGVLATIEGKEMVLGGDIVIELLGIKISNGQNLEEAAVKLEQLEKGAEIKTTVIRHGKEIELTLKKP